MRQQLTAFMFIAHLLPNLRLARDLAMRDLAAKYKRSLLGPTWLVLTPLALLAIYWLVFGVIFGISWPVPTAAGTGNAGFLLPFFTGLAAYLTLSDVVNSSTTLFVAKRTFVVKSPFPLWVLIVANLVRAAVHAGVLLTLVLALALIQGRLTIMGAAVLVPTFILIAFLMCGLSVLLAALGPFVGDISEAMRLLLRILFYATPVTYPLTMVPEPYRSWMWLNPLASIVEAVREPLIFGSLPPRPALVVLCLSTLLVLGLGAWIYGRVNKVIADVV